MISALATTGAYGLVLLMRAGPVGVLVMAVLVLVSVVAYRSYQVLHRRHQALAHVHEFVALNNERGSVVDLAGVMLDQVRALMRARTAELLLIGESTALRLRVGEDGVPHPLDEASAVEASDLARICDSSGALLAPRKTRSRQQRAWLRSRGARDAVVTPLVGADGSVAGTLLIFDRLGGTGSFTRDDQTLLQTLAGHFSVALSSGWRRERLGYEATHDVLTGLGNRALLNRAIEDALAAGPGGGGAVLLLDLDRFKEVNDTLGHHVGDALLSVIARRLRAGLPAEATIARLGGDEFAALLPAGPAGCGADAPGHRWGGAAAHALARRVGDAVAATVELPEASISTRASIGVALIDAGSTTSQLLRHADTAMYAAKSGQSGVVVYTTQLDKGRAERLALLADLHGALERSELTVCYQPKLDLRTGTIPSVEALVRWEHPRLGQLSPDLFIPLAEANGLIAALTHTVLAQALSECAAWRADGLAVAVAVNLSARTVNDPELPEQISAALLHAGVPASSLILEVTESAVMADPDRAVTILQRIAGIGVTLSLDDFGTGYSSLAYLQRLPVREVKIDKSFVTGLMDEDATSQVLVRSIINLGSSLGLRVVAEGVEDAATLELLSDLGCHLAQGYHISRPTFPARVAAQVRSSAAGTRRLRALAELPAPATAERPVAPARLA